jgi:N-acetyl sugar amidotransferase
MIKYCLRCVMPSTKPDLHIDAEGVCAACRNIERRKQVDWAQRKRELLAVVERFRRPSGDNYDCIVPVSGGKDSTYQAVKLKEMGLNPLCVTSTTCMLSDIGRRNIENLKKVGLDYIEVSPNPIVRRKLNRIGLLQVGDISWPEHVGIFTIPVRASVQFGVPLLVWGENSQNEYGGPAAAADNHVLTRRWLEEFGGLLGLRVSDLVGQEGIQPRDLIQYTYPTDAELARVGTTGIFLGHYLPWDGLENALFSTAHGFETYHKMVEGSLVNYENLDNNHTGIHDYFKFLKYGFGRATDLACLQIRRGRLARETAIELVRKNDGKFPWSYLGCPLERIVDELDMSVDDFIKVCDRFTNKKLFVCDAQGRLLKDRHGNLTKINYDNA